MLSPSYACVFTPLLSQFISHSRSLFSYAFFFFSKSLCKFEIDWYVIIAKFALEILEHSIVLSTFSKFGYFHDFFFCSLWNNVYISISVTEELTLPSYTTNLYEHGETLSKEHIEIKKKDSFLDINDIGNKQHHSYLKSSKFSFHPPKNFNNCHYFL